MTTIMCEERHAKCDLNNSLFLERKIDFNLFQASLDGAVFMGLLLIGACIGLIVRELVVNKALNWAGILIAGVLLGIAVMSMGLHTLLTKKPQSVAKS